MTKTGILTVLLGISLLVMAGCAQSHAQPGETVAEGHRRHIRNMRLQRQMLLDDLDTFFLTDQPSKLTDKNIP